MNELMKADVQMTSLDIAEIVGKEHKNVMRDIRSEIEDLGVEISQLIFELSTYTSDRGKKYPCYKFGKDGAMQLALKYDAVTRYKVIKRIEELENNQQSQFNVPTTYKEALLQLVEKVEENEKLQIENLVLVQQNNELQPKASYYDMVLQNKSLLSVSKIAKDYGMSATKLNKLLHELGVQYKQGDIWLLYAKYQAKGYTQTTTHVIDADKSRVSTKWTQKGRLFIYDLLKGEGILPVIEREEAS
ncbi:phage regulatory protein/antirepressor Ant [Lysinibacillus piscis]|uniref:Antirepressor protein C-terminal domain-containing protein n=1 Tax=Lysinibacillus piscis TaxID=2518931 RepID=A0ABQ5NM04_9BACI|nr:phage regulatory protein/antirepressor Ant [Lysinibacillus sp. KH24]GLC89379.1 hypothetical protein LYSBPC_25060 [Lysinibacillus sp. KH24]